MELTGVDLVSGDFFWNVGKVAPDISRGRTARSCGDSFLVFCVA